jgi:predicted extracellular nuclease
MSLRLATFNVENLMSRFDFSGFRNELWKDRTLALYEIRTEAEFQTLERARAISHADDARQLTALAIAATRADIIVMQEVDNLEALKAFEYGYLFKMIGEGYRNKYSSTGNDSRGIDVAVMMRPQTADGEEIEFVRMTSHAQVTFDELGLWDPALAAVGIEAHERIFRRDCLEIDVRIGGRPLTLYGVHFKSMGSPRNGLDGRSSTMPLRLAEARAVRRIIEDRFGGVHAGSRRWAICGDMNDYRERVVIGGDQWSGHTFDPVEEEASALDVFLADGFASNPVTLRPELDRWTLFHTRGPQERHLCQLDYILLSPSLQRANATAVPDIVRNGQPWRTPFPPGQEVARFPRAGWDRPKASDHCPVAISLHIPAA